MVCEKCKGEMNWSIEGATQGWRCPFCGWSVITTYIDEINIDEAEYSLYIRNMTQVDNEKVKLVAQIAGVNFIIAKKMMEGNETCILKAKAPEIKTAIAKLQEQNISFKINPSFKY